MTAKPFVEVQKQVAGLLKDRILVGHAVHNDLKVRAQTWRRTYLVAKDCPYRLYYSPIHVTKPKTPSIMQVNRDLSTPNTPLCATWWNTSSESRSKTGSILVYVQLWFCTFESNTPSSSVGDRRTSNYGGLSNTSQRMGKRHTATSRARSPQEEEAFIRRRW